MNSAYQHLALADVRPGMVLADELLDQQGKVLLVQGAILSAAIIALLPRHGVDRLAVLRDDPAGVAPPPAPDHAALQARLAQLFRHSDAAHGSPCALLRHYMAQHRLAPQDAP